MGYFIRSMEGVKICYLHIFVTVTSIQIFHFRKLSHKNTVKRQLNPVFVQTIAMCNIHGSFRGIQMTPQEILLEKPIAHNLSHHDIGHGITLSIWRNMGRDVNYANIKKHTFSFILKGATAA